MLTDAKKYWCESKEDALKILKENGIDPTVSAKYPRGFVINGGKASLIFDREVYDLIDVDEPCSTAKCFVDFANKYFEGTNFVCEAETRDDDDDYILFYHRGKRVYFCALYWPTKCASTYGGGEFECVNDDPELLLREILLNTTLGLREDIRSYEEDVDIMKTINAEIKEVIAK